MRKNPHGKILKRESKKHHLSIVPKSYPIKIIRLHPFTHSFSQFSYVAKCD